MIDLVSSIYQYFVKHRKLLYVLLVAIVVMLAMATSHINFKEDISSFLPKNDDAGRGNAIYQRFASMNKLWVSIGISDTTIMNYRDIIIDVVEHFVEQLEQSDKYETYINRLDYKVEPQQIFALSQFVVDNMPYFLDEEDYARLYGLLSEDYIEQQFENIKRILISPMGTMMINNIMADPLQLSAPVLLSLRDFQFGEFAEQFNLYNDFIFTRDGKEALISIVSEFSPSETRQNAELLKLLDVAIDNTHAKFDNIVNISYFGSIDFAVTNANRIKYDSLFSSTISIILILSILIFVFRSFKNILLIVGTLSFGWLFALGLLSILKDEISLIAVGISSIIIGIAINYPLHFIMRHKHQSHVPTVIKDIVAPLTIGNITTIGAFMSLFFIGSDAMRDLGAFASLLLLGTIVFVLLFLPHLLTKNVDLKYSQTFFEKFGSWEPKFNRWFLLAFIVLTMLFFSLSFNTKFETDMNTLNYMTEKQKTNLERFMSIIEQGQHTIFYIHEGNNQEDALIAYEASKTVIDSMLSVGLLSNVGGIGVFLPSKAIQEQRLEHWKTFCEKHESLFLKINDIAIGKGFRDGAFSKFEDIINKKYEPQESDYFELIITTIANNYLAHDANGSLVMSVLQTTHDNPTEIISTLNQIDNRSFAFDTGTFGRRMISTLSQSFNTILFICGTIVFVFLILTLGRIELAIIAFLPLTIGWFWILGIMNITGIHFNIVNIILATFIFGQGDDYTIFMAEGLMHEYSYKRKVLNSYKSSISLSALIMFIGIGSLIFAQHPALRSLAQVTIIGMGSVVLMAFVLPPILFNAMTKTKRGHRLMPITIVNLASSIYSFIVFIVGSMVLTIYGFFLFTLGKTTDTKKFNYHRFLCFIARLVLRLLPRVKTTYNNYDKTIFDKPSIIICNHQSHIDLMCVMSLTPKLIILTNDWVWNSPFYGRLIKYADFYPVSGGVENALEKMQAIVKKGYSIMIFPEGTRSEDCSINRFHRGAFYLAEKLNLDILPVLIHGVGHLLPKKEFMLRKGEIHINVMERMKYDAMGTLYAQRAKNTRIMYKEEYEKLAAEIETSDYYADLVMHNYIYKGPTIEHTVRKNLKKNKNYSDIISNLKKCNNVLIKNCGYGELPLLASLVHKDIQIVATDSDSDKLELASNCAWVKENLKYIKSFAGTEENFDIVIDAEQI
jgi:1-acyl-sn-glycerol-3-phosphate acyltransferase